MQIKNHRFVFILIATVFLFTFFPYAPAKAAEDKFIDNPNWIDATPAEVELMWGTGESFVLMCYRWTCFNSNLRKTVLDGWMTKYNIKIYGMDCDKYGISSFLWQKINENSVALPVIAVVENETKYTIVTADTSMRIAQEAINEMLGIIDTSAMDFYAANQYAFDNYDVSASAVSHALKPRSAIDAQIVAQADSIVKASMTDYQKLKAIHDWVANNIYYDWVQFETGIGDNSALTVYRNRAGVCTGYSNLTRDLCNAAGIPCRYVTGFATGVGSDDTFPDVWSAYNTYLNSGNYSSFKSFVKSSSNHAWNEAFVNGRWVILDTTWDSNNEYYANSYGIIIAPSVDTYFDPSIQDFSSTHLFFAVQQIGDINDDGDLDIGDANLLYMYIRGRVTLTVDALLAADVNSDGEVDIGDVNMLYMFIRGKILSIG